MQLSPRTQSILLLTTHLPTANAEDSKPLSIAEYGRFAQRLVEVGNSPEDLLDANLGGIKDKLCDKDVTPDRLERLLSRGGGLALCMEKWLGAGLWVITRSDPEYPVSLRRQLGAKSPPVFFGCGNKRLLNAGGLAVVGSRKADQKNLEYARKLGEMAAVSGVTIISGGARGIDQSAMLGALNVEGTAVGVVADNLLRHSTSRNYRSKLINGSLCLISPFNPEAGFNVGNAMQRNKYIYTLSMVAVVVCSEKKGGTWNGALENLDKQWAPLWVKEATETNSGNYELIRRSAAPLASDISSIDFEILYRTLPPARPTEEEDLFSHSKDSGENGEEHEASRPSCHPEKATRESTPQESKVEVEDDNIPGPGVTEPSLYDLFLVKLERSCSEKAITQSELEKKLSLTKGQLKSWLNQALAEGKIKKLSKPARYTWSDNAQLLISFSERT